MKEEFGEKLKVVSIHCNEFGDDLEGFQLKTAEGQELAELTQTVGFLKVV